MRIKLMQFSVFCGALLVSSASLAHNYLVETQAPAGYVHDLAMRVPHGCQGSAVNQVRIKIPEGVFRVTAEDREILLAVESTDVDAAAVHRDHIG